MFSRVVRSLGALLVLAASIGFLAGDAPAEARTEASDNDESCISCHEALYQLHDIGKWYCLCEVKARCTFCHGGVVGALEEQAAHEGMIAKPIQTTESVCRSCHPDDYQDRMSTFVARAGLSATPCPTAVAASISIIAPPGAPTHSTGLATWQIAALSILGVGLVVLTWFARRCWLADCLRKRTEP
jgi:hypothetical protein